MSIIFAGIMEVFLERNPMNVLNVVKPFHITVVFNTIKEFMLERNPTIVMNVVKPFQNTVISKSTKGHTHTREVPSECHQCGKARSQQSHLQNHKRIYIAQKPYEYNQSGKAF